MEGVPKDVLAQYGFEEKMKNLKGNILKIPILSPEFQKPIF